jgi:predicted PurR-regulated permease PerM
MDGGVQQPERRRVADSRSPGEVRLRGVPVLTARAVWQGASIAALIVVLAVGLLLAAWLIAYPLALFFAAIVLANALAPAVRLFERLLPTWGAVVGTYVLVVLVVAAIGWLVIPSLLAEASEASLTLLARAQSWLDRTSPDVAQRLRESIIPLVSEMSADVIQVPLTVLRLFTGGVLVLLMAIYWSLGSDDLRRYVFSLVPHHLRDEAADVADTIGGYLRARVIVGLLVGAVIFVGLSLIGVEYSLVLAVLAAIGELIPYLGPTAAAAPALLFALSISPWQAGATVALYIAVQQFKSFLIMPIIIRRHANIPPLLVIVALIAGGAVGGVVGAMIAPPLAGAIRVVVLRIVSPPIRRWADASNLGAGDGPEDSSTPASG